MSSQGEGGDPLRRRRAQSVINRSELPTQPPVRRARTEPAPSSHRHQLFQIISSSTAAPLEDIGRRLPRLSIRLDHSESDDEGEAPTKRPLRRVSVVVRRPPQGGAVTTTTISIDVRLLVPLVVLSCFVAAASGFAVPPPEGADGVGREWLGGDTAAVVRSTNLVLAEDELAGGAVWPRVVIVAALGGSKRRISSNLTMIEHNLRSHFDGWDCIVLAWHAEAHRMSEHSPYLHGRCGLVLREGWQWASLVNLTRGAVRARAYSEVCLLLDDVELSAAFNASELAGYVAEGTGYGIVSPRVIHGTFPAMERYPRKRQLSEANPLPVVRMKAVELYAAVFSAAAWECFASLFDDEARGRRPPPLSAGQRTSRSPRHRAAARCFCRCSTTTMARWPLAGGTTAATRRTARPAPASPASHSRRWSLTPGPAAGCTRWASAGGARGSSASWSAGSVSSTTAPNACPMATRRRTCRDPHAG